MPSRLYGIMAAGRPVVVAADPESETAQVVERVGCGIVIPPSRPELLAEVIRDAYEGRYDLDAMGARGREYVDGGRRHPRGPRPLSRAACGSWSSLMRKVFWGSLAALAWTHVGYPAAAAVARGSRRSPCVARTSCRRVTIIVAAHNEEDVIARRVENLLELDYPPELVEIVVASDASTDRTHEIVREIAAREPRVTLLECPRGGRWRRRTSPSRGRTRDVVAFSDANATWAPDALRKLVRAFADPEVAYVLRPARARGRGRHERRGRLLAHGDVAARAGVGDGLDHRRQRLHLRRAALRLRRRRPALRPRPLVPVPHGAARTAGGLRPGEALAFEKPTPDVEDEYRRKVRMFEHGWLMLHKGRMLERLPPGYLVKLVSHRHLRYGSGVLHLALAGSSFLLARRGGVYRLAWLGQLAFLAEAARRPGMARYYTLVTWGTVESLKNYVDRGVPAVWDKAPGTR